MHRKESSVDHTGMSPGTPLELPVEALAALQTGNKIEAIKLVRAARRLDLKDAKDLVDRYIAGQPGLRQQMTAAGAEQGRKLVFALAVAIAIGAAVYFFLPGA
jgi:ribosomal protein L7/L12